MSKPIAPVARVVVNGGSGRIGMHFMSAASKTDSIQVVSANDLRFDPKDPEAAAKLLRYDSVRGPMQVGVEGDALVFGDERVKLTAEKDPSKLESKGSIVVDATSLGKTDFLKGHLAAGADVVIKSSPISGPASEYATFVYGVNHADFDPAKHKLISAASCTTNASAVPIKVILDAFGINRILNLVTVHAATASNTTVDGGGNYSILDAFEPGKTGASQAIAEVLPSLKGKTPVGISVRGPVKDGSYVNLVIELATPATTDEVKKAIRAAAGGSLKGVLGTVDDELTSVHIVQMSQVALAKGELPMPSIVEMKTIQITDPDATGRGKVLSLSAWYDNEQGYTGNMARLVQHVAAKVAQAKAVDPAQAARSAQQAA